MTDKDLKLLTWDGHGINGGTDYTAGFLTGREWGLPKAKAKTIQRWGAWPVVSGLDRGTETMELVVKIVGSDKRALRDQLLRWFDPEDETPKKLIIEDEDGTGDRYKYAICEEIEPINIGGYASLDMFIVRLVTHGDVRWRRITFSGGGWGITATGQTTNIVNAGSDNAWPVLKVKPTSSKSGGYSYKRFAVCKWRSNYAVYEYPVRFGPLDTATLITGGKMQADGDDLRVIVDGKEVDRWIDGIDTANTYIWINLSFAPASNGTLQAAIPASGSITSIEIASTDSMIFYPPQGLLIIDSEIFFYDTKNTADHKFTNITRAVKGSSEAAHSAGTTVYLVPHQIEIVYGNASATAPSVDGTRKPAFVTGSSSNTEWVYTGVFGDNLWHRPGQWRPYGSLSLAGFGGTYNGNHRTLDNSFGAEHTELGAWINTLIGNSYGWQLDNPCGIINAAWSGGEKRAVDITRFTVHCRYLLRGDAWWTNQYTVPAPTVANTWQSWSKAYDGSNWSEANTVALLLYFYPSDVEVSGVSVRLSTTDTPSTSIGSEQADNYTLSCTITNNTTGEAITLQADLALNSELEVDTDNETVTYLADGTNQLAALDLVGGVRDRWLKLVPGTNQLQFDDVGTVGVTLTTTYEERYY